MVHFLVGCDEGQFVEDGSGHDGAIGRIQMLAATPSLGPIQ
jgi:hypothetical protein